MIDAEHGVVCEACGTLDEATSDALTALRERIVTLEDQLVECVHARDAMAEKMGRQHRELGDLKGESDKGPKASKHYAAACGVLDEWRTLIKPNAREVYSDARLKLTIARLNGGYTEDDLKLCVVGYSKMPYVVDGKRSSHGEPTQWYADVSLIFRDPNHVDAGIAMAGTTAPTIGLATMARVAWDRVWRQNRNLIQMELQHEFGAGIRDEEYGRVMWPCPRCEAHADQLHPPAPLRLYDTPANEGRLLECSYCGLDEGLMLGIDASKNGGGLVGAAMAL